MERHFPRAVTALGDIFDHIDAFAARHAVPETALYAVKFVVEELFTNMVKYSPSDTSSDIGLELERQGGKIVVRLSDSGVDPFDVTQSADADVSLGLEERKVGGLGLHLVKRMVDSLDYSYKDRHSVITFSKTVE
jgi:anti-sigma regulatory factor (Ser/Thr protein kinase)